MDEKPVFVMSGHNPDYDSIVYETAQQVLWEIETALEYLDGQPDGTLTLVIKRQHMTDEQLAQLEETD